VARRTGRLAIIVPIRQAGAGGHDHGSDRAHTLIAITIQANTPGGVQTGTVTATNGHPFWVTNPGHWTNADHLTPNQQLHTPTNQPATILATHTHTATLTAYNLTIHTYYVLAGSTPVLVHNSGGGACGVGNFGAGDTFYHIMSTAQGDVEMLAGVSINGTNLTLSDVAVYGTGDMVRGSLDSAAILRELRTVIAPAAAEQGYTSLTITGVRLTGPVGQQVNITLDLSKYLPGSGGPG
jgi:hypothetical protein